VVLLAVAIALEIAGLAVEHRADKS